MQPQLTQFLAWVDSLGALGPAVFIPAYALACVFMLPASLLTIGAGAVFGLGKGFAFVSAGSTAGAALSFLIGRTIARPWVAKKLASTPRFAAVDAAIAREGAKTVFLLRLSPLFPFNVMNYVLGLTQIGLRDFVLASWLGMMPGTFLYVYLGALAGDLARVGSARQRGPLEWAFLAGGLAATVALSLFVSRLAKKALAETA